MCAALVPRCPNWQLRTGGPCLSRYGYPIYGQLTLGCISAVLAVATDGDTCTGLSVGVGLAGGGIRSEGFRSGSDTVGERLSLFCRWT
ncbi:MAG: hypothetical protein ACI8Z5_001349 [Lentimonas sp.]|jgi:hypothetical protein